MKEQFYKEAAQYAQKEKNLILSISYRGQNKGIFFKRWTNLAT